MDISLFKKIIDEVHQGGCCAITLAGWGEPLINPEICSFLDYATNKFYELKINTNGLLLNDKVSHAILKSNVSLVVFSAEGTTTEIYEKTRCGGGFLQLIKILGGLMILEEIIIATVKHKQESVELL